MINDKKGGNIRHTRSAIRHPGERKNMSKSAVRALDVLEYFSVVRRPLRATDIANALDLHSSSADQLLKSMVDAAYLLIDSDGKLYRPSPRLMPFANWLAESYFGEDALSKMVTSLAARTGQIVTLAAPQGSWLQLVDVAAPPGFDGLVRKGSRVSAIGSTLGAAFLAAHPDREIERWIDRMPEARHIDAAARAELTQSINATRDRGFACGLAERLFSIALALPRPSSGVQLVMGLAGEVDYMEPRMADLADQLRRSAASLTES